MQDVELFLSFLSTNFVDFEESNVDLQQQEASFHLKAIYIYPVKSCAAIQVDSWPIGEQGESHLLHPHSILTPRFALRPRMVFYRQ